MHVAPVYVTEAPYLLDGEQNHCTSGMKGVCDLKAALTGRQVRGKLCKKY